MSIGWLTCIPAVLLPHSLCRSTTANAPANRQMPIASVVSKHTKKTKIEKKMKKAVWISYDLGIKGDYQGLYSWLDDHKAVECGNSIAYIQFEVKTDLIKELTEELNLNVDFKAGDRVYIVRREVDGLKTSIKGSFIKGKRKSNPWEGYGTSVDNSIDGNE